MSRPSGKRTAWHEELAIILLAASGFVVAMAWSNAFSEALNELLPPEEEGNKWKRAGAFVLHAVLVTAIVLALVHVSTRGDYTTFNAALVNGM